MKPAVDAEMVGRRRHVGRGPGGLGHPAALALRVTACWRGVVLHEETQHGLVHDAGVAALEPVVPPAQRLLQPADGGAGHADMRVFVRPGADEALARAREIFAEAEDGATVSVGPARDRIDRHLDRRIILADRAMPPEGVAALMLEPVLKPEPTLLEPLAPEAAPVRTARQRVGWQRVAEEHLTGPGELVAQQAAAHVMDVVGITVIGRADRDHGLEG